jgi:hypothetical protein
MTDLDHAATIRRFRLHGVMILTLGLVAGVTINFAALPKTVLSAHVIGITAGLAAVAVAGLIPHVRLSVAMMRAVSWMLLASLYLGLLTQWLGGLFGLTRMFIVTAVGFPEGNQAAERIVELIVKGITPLTILPFLVLGWGLVRASRDATAPKSF